MEGRRGPGCDGASERSGDPSRAAGERGSRMPVADPASSWPSFNESALHEQIMRQRAVNNVTNLAFLAFEYLCIAAVIGGAIVFCEYRGAWGLARAWDIPVVALAVVLVGGLQHRLAG